MARSIRFVSVVALSVFMVLSFRGCTAISIQPECPTQMQVGEMRPVVANEENPGAIARYLWEVFPADRGRFANPRAANTTFQALEQGEVVLRLTASDGLYQVVSDCRTRVQGVVGVAVSLMAMPSSTDIGEPVTLTCESIGSTEAIRRDIVQIEGRLVDLQEVSVGVVRFEAERDGELVFRCVGENADDEQSEPSLVTVTIVAPSNQNANQNGNQNRNGNANGNDNSSRNDNANANVNQNANANANSNVNRNDNR